MARKLNAWPGRVRVGTGSMYDQWLDGNIYELVVGEDVLNINTARAGMSMRAKQNGLKVRTTAPRDGQTLIVQAYQPENGKRRTAR